MAFEDLARHMAARDKKRLSAATNAEDMLAEAAVANRRLSRTRDLVLGVLLLASAVASAVMMFLLKTADDASANESERFTAAKWGTVLGVVALTALAVGARKTWRGLRGHSHLAPADEDDGLETIAGAVTRTGPRYQR